MLRVAVDAQPASLHRTHTAYLNIQTDKVICRGCFEPKNYRVYHNNHMIKISFRNQCGIRDLG